MKMILASIVIGLVASVATSWSIALFVNVFAHPSGRESVVGGLGVWSVVRWEAPGATRIYSIRTKIPNIPPSQSGTSERAIRALIPPYADELGSPSANFLGSSPGMDARWLDARGWPFKSFATEADVVPQTNSHTIRYGMEVSPPWTPTSGPTEPRVIPFRPLWNGLILNALLWAIVMYCVLVSISQLRKWRRRITNRCAACGHELMASQATCPECGKVRRTVA